MGVVDGDRFVVDVQFESGSDVSHRGVDLTVELPECVTLDRATTAYGDVELVPV